VAITGELSKRLKVRGNLRRASKAKRLNSRTTGYGRESERGRKGGVKLLEGAGDKAPIASE